MARTFLVSGATGRQGGAVARSLLRRGAAVRCLTRVPERARSLAQAGAEVVRGDLLKKESLVRALKGMDGFFLVTTPFASGLAAPNFEEEARQARAALEAALAAGTRHVVLSSAARPQGAETLPVFASKAAVEAMFVELRVPGTVVRSSTFMETFTSPAIVEGLRAGRLVVPGTSTLDRIELVAVHDLGELVTSAFVHPVGAMGRTVDLIGDSRTVSEIAQLLGAAAGRPITVESPTGPSSASSDGIPMDDGAHKQRVESAILDLQHRWGVRLTRFDVFLQGSDLRARVEAPAAPPSATKPKSPARRRVAKSRRRS